MGFQEKLKHLVERIEGGVACVLMGSDGIPIDSYKAPNAHSNFDPITFGIENTGLFHQLRQISSQTQFGEPTEFVIHSEDQIAIFRFLTDEYFLLLSLTSDGNTGKGKYYLRSTAAGLEQDLFS
ncbi:MAG TPA: hypothetical protein DCE42_18030 [Myxococcales bacterium]|mgnify:CR=1 FL=1|nr:hypothetical protein [Deltaproteobacteria bacterium]MBU48174.1 hypothetical protein [Deltaproteobacteria bacterium]HAA56669.1 hypothetical protein [Myxococcales bacterium]|tara:strand:- start:2416 stop:2787 length:372 start_codon:yes stop_codon:yes gene_type:complete